MHDQIDDSPQLRLTCTEYWLLQTAVEWRIPLCFLEAEGYRHPSSIERMFNKPGHGLARTQLLASLVGLFRDGLIIVRRGEEEPWIPSEDQIASALCEGSSCGSMLYYGLTEKGGAVWEAFAAPDWDRYLREHFDNRNRSGEITCATRSRLQYYLEYLGLNRYEQRIHSETIRIHEHGSWQATYWKESPHGFTAEFSCDWEDRETSSDNLTSLAFAGFCEFRDKWYGWRNDWPAHDPNSTQCFFRKLLMKVQPE